MQTPGTLGNNSFEVRSVKYPKYIPIEERKKGFKFPCTKLDRKAPRCYFDMQTWYGDYLEEKELRGQYTLRQTASDTDAFQKRSKKCKHLTSENSFQWTDRKSIITHKRFGTKNNRYLQCGCSNEATAIPKRVEMYIQITKQQRFKLNLFHVKTEMVVKCLQNFFKPFDDTTVMFVSDLDTHIDKITKCNRKDIFDCNISDNLKRAKAILYLDDCPARLLRHKEMCVLDTLATIIEIRKEELLILSMSISRYNNSHSI